MLKGKRAYICSPLSAKTREERMFNMGLAKAYLDTVRMWYGGSDRTSMYQVHGSLS